MEHVQIRSCRRRLVSQMLREQTLGRLATALEFRTADALERQILSLWNTLDAELPPDLVKLREYVSGLGA